jgi:hypothetical protein
MRSRYRRILLKMQNGDVKVKPKRPDHERDTDEN